jgi:hypothetical protein
MNRDCKCETHYHSRGIGPHWLVDVPAELRKPDDPVATLGDFGMAHTEQQTISSDVLQPCECAVKTRAEFKEACDSAPSFNVSAVGDHDPGEHLQKCGLACAILAKYPESFTGVEIEGYRIKGIVPLMQASAQEYLLE